MGFFSFLLGAPKALSAVTTAVETGVKMFDNAFYTDQEKAESTAKMQNLWLKIQELLANENSIKSVTRRVLAWAIMGVFLLLVVMACVIWPLNSDWALFIKNTIVETKITYFVMIIGFFYFGYWGVSNIIKAKKE